MIEGQQFPTYMITPIDLNDVELRCGSILEKKKPFVVIQQEDNFEEDSLQPNKSFEEGTSLKNLNTKNEKQKEPINSNPIIEKPSVYTSTRPFPERLQVDRGLENHIMLPNYDFIDELKNVCFKVPLL